MLKAGYGLVRESGRVFLEAAPVGLNPSTLESAIREVTGVRDLYVWEVTTGMPCLSAEIHVDEGINCHGIRCSVGEMLHDRFEMAAARCRPSTCRRPARSGPIPIMSVYSSSPPRKPMRVSVCALNGYTK